MKPEELSKLADEAVAKHYALKNRKPLRVTILTALQQAVDVQREEDAVIADQFARRWESPELKECFVFRSEVGNAIRAGKQTVQEESEGV